MLEQSDKKLNRGGFLKRTWGKNLTILMLGIIITGCGEKSQETAKETKAYTFAVSTTVQSLDTKLAIDPTSQLVLNNVMEGLYKLNAKGEIVPGGANGLPEISKDGLKYVIRLRKDAMWSNGTPVVADDYVYSWKRTLSNQDSPNIGFFESIKNGKEIISGTMKPDKLGVYAKDKNTLVINLSTPIPYFISMLINTAFFPQKQEVVEKEGDRYGTNSDSVIYNGPYILNSLKNTGISEKWKLKKNTKYWDSKSVRMNEIDMNVIKDVGTGVSLFEAEKLDDVPLSGEYAKQNIKNDSFVSEVSDSALLLEVNHGNSKLNNIHLRRALSNAIDRKNLVHNVIANGSVPLTSILTDNLKVSKEVTAGNYDLDRAKKELEIAKNELKQNNFTFDILTNDQDLGVKASEFIQGQLNRLEGIKVNIVPVPATVQFDRLSKKEFDLSISGVAADYPDPFSILSIFRKNSPNNHGNYSSDKYEDFLNESLKETDKNKRWKLLSKAEETINSDLGVIPLLQLNNARLRNRNVIGITSNSVGPKYDFKYLNWK